MEESTGVTDRNGATGVVGLRECSRDVGIGLRRAVLPPRDKPFV